jgi:predicted RNA-binding Zn ribbon-like protein
MESAPDTAAAVFDETDSFKLAVGQETGGDVVEELKAELTALLAKRDLETGRHRVQLAHFFRGQVGYWRPLEVGETAEVVVDEVSQEAVDERRRELEALLRETRDPELKQLPLRAPRGDAAADCWAARFAAKNVTNATLLFHFPHTRIDHLERKTSEALSDFNREHADLEAVREKARAVAAWRAGKQDAAARIEDHVAVAEHLATKLRRKITSLRRDRPAIDAWLEPTEKFVASTFQHLRAPDDNVMPAGGPTADEDATIIAQLILHRGLCGGRKAGWCGVGGRTLVFWERVRDGLVAAHPRWRGPSGEMVSVGWLQEYARRGGRDSLVERALMLPDVAAREEREQPWARLPANIRPYVAPVSMDRARLFLVRLVLTRENYDAYLGYLAAQEGVKELAVHAVPRPNDILTYFLVGVTKNMRLKGFSKLAATTCDACTMLSRRTSVGGVTVSVWKQLTTRYKYVIYKQPPPPRRKRPRAEPAPAEAKRRRPFDA